MALKYVYWRPFPASCGGDDEWIEELFDWSQFLPVAPFTNMF